MSQGSDRRHDQALPRSQRQARGVYYTPDAVVKYIVGETLKADLWQAGPPRVLDPACGDGAFLSEVAVRLVEQAGASALKCCLFGIDRDEVAVAAARTRVARRVLGANASQQQIATLGRQLKNNIVVGDALLEPLPTHWPREFDAIVGNPPYVNIRRLAKDPQLVARCRERFRCARRGFDLYVLFVERALELLRAGGRCGVIVPNKLATLDYAAECRRMLVEEARIDSLTDLSDLNLFAGASVYPHVVVFEKSPPRPNQQVRVVTKAVPRDDGIRAISVRFVRQAQLNRRGVFAWDESADIEARVPTQPLGELCRLHSGTTGFMAQQIASELCEREETSRDAFPFITSGNIDRYAVSLGDVRYMRRRFADPVLPRECSLLTAGKRRLFASPKLVFAGMSRRLEVAWHAEPLALGVQVFAAAEILVDPFYLLAVLNSRFMSDLFRARFSAKRLGGGFLSINKGQLAQLPIVSPEMVGSGERPAIERLAKLGRELTGREMTPALNSEVDLLVAMLYRQSASVAA
jgi:hypothetical protein